MNNLFYAPDISHEYYQLHVEESKHLIRVLRKETGDKVYLTDGKGFFYTCRIVDDNPKHCKVEIITKKEGEDKSPYKLWMGVAPTKNISRYEWFLEKSTEIGIDKIIPFIGFHSERKDIKPDRLNRVITAAMKQSLKSFHPELTKLFSFKELIELPFEGEKYIAYIDEKVTKELFHNYKPPNDAFILIGPEGDFSRDEVELAVSKGFTPVKLGHSRLRTETAAVAACHTVNLLNL